MQWEFRKALESFESYRNQSSYYINQVDCGTAGILSTLVRQIQHIISEPKQPKVSKVLAMRFAKDIMILGREDVSKQLTKLVPQILKICSHRLESTDRDRGQTLFYDDQEYIKGNQQTKKQLQIYGSTYFTLCMQSIYHWAKWIPVTQNGKQSIYSKGYQTLLDRGVTFQPIFHYYKNSDTQKFKNTYKVQFFSQQSFHLNSEPSLRQSAYSQTPQNNISTKNLRTIEQIKQYLQILSLKNKYNNRTQEYNKSLSVEIDAISKKAAEIYEYNFPKSTTSLQFKKLSAEKKLRKQWLDNFMILYGMQKSKKINVDQFLQRCNEISDEQQIEIDNYDQESLSQYNNAIKSGSFKKKVASPKRQKQSQQSDTKQQYEQMLRQQQDKYHRKSEQYIHRIESQKHQLKQLKSAHKLQIQQLKQKYQQRIKLLKDGIMNKNEKLQSEQMKVLQRQNKILKNKIQTYSNYEGYMEQMQKSITDLEEEVRVLKIQNLSLKKQLSKNLEINDDNKINRIYQLEQKLAKSNKYNTEQSPKKQPQNNSYKKIESLKDQIYIYKKSLSDQREKYQQQLDKIKKQLTNKQQQNRVLKDQIYYLQKKIDLKEIEAAQLSQQIKLCKLMDQQANIMMKNYVQPSKQNQINQHIIKDDTNANFRKQTKNAKLHTFSYPKYQKLRNSFIGQKQRFFRFVRCCLKKKDLLMKQNQLEVGLITDSISFNELKHTIFFTNISEIQIDSFQIYFQHPNHIQIQATSQFIFCIQPKQQQKVVAKCIMSTPIKDKYDPVYLSIKFKKNSKTYQYKINLPTVLYKNFTFSKIDPTSSPIKNFRETLSLNYSKNVLSDEKTLFSYFPEIIAVNKKVYECEIYQRDTNFRANLRIQLSGQNFLILHITPIAYNPSMNFGILSDSQKKIMQQLLAFFQLVFRR